MGKILKDPFEKYGEAKEEENDDYVRRYGDPAPDFAEVKKALRVKRLSWMLPSGIGFGLFLVLLASFGMEFLVGFLAVTGITLALLIVICGVIWCIEAGSEAGKVLERAKQKGVKDA